MNWNSDKPDAQPSLWSRRSTDRRGQPPAYTYPTFDNHGQQVWVHVPPPSRWDYRRRGLREAAYLVVGALVLAAIAALTVILITIATEPAPAAGATDQPGKPAWVCRRVK